MYHLKRDFDEVVFMGRDNSPVVLSMGFFFSCLPAKSQLFRFCAEMKWMQIVLMGTLTHSRRHSQYIHVSVDGTFFFKCTLYNVTKHELSWAPSCTVEVACTRYFGLRLE